MTTIPDMTMRAMTRCKRYVEFWYLKAESVYIFV